MLGGLEISVNLHFGYAATNPLIAPAASPFSTLHDMSEPAKDKKTKKDKKDRKEKKEKNAKSVIGSTETNGESTSTFSLFGGKSDAQLEDIFSKGVS